jgi:hypothetical protein
MSTRVAVRMRLRYTGFFIQILLPYPYGCCPWLWLTGTLQVFSVVVMVSLHDFPIAKEREAALTYHDILTIPIQVTLKKIIPLVKIVRRIAHLAGNGKDAMNTSSMYYACIALAALFLNRH